MSCFAANGPIIDKVEDFARSLVSGDVTLDAVREALGAVERQLYSEHLAARGPVVREVPPPELVCPTCHLAARSHVDGVMPGNLVPVHEGEPVETCAAYARRVWHR